MSTMKRITIGAAAIAASAALTAGGLQFADAANYSIDDYGPNPHASNSVHESWGAAAWPNCPTDISPAGYADLPVHVRTDLAPLAKELLKKTEEMGYDLKPDETGAFNCRAIRGSNKPSNHSRGLAIDLNWNSNPMGSTFVSDIPPAVVKMWEESGFYWGGRYEGRPDAMHFEYIGSKADVQVYLDKLGGGDGGGGDDPAPDPDPDSKYDWCYEGPQTKISKGSQGGAVKDAQCLLNLAGHDAGTIDGVFGAKTDAAVRSFQKSKGLEVDGIVGPKTWAALGHKG